MNTLFLPSYIMIVVCTSLIDIAVAFKAPKYKRSGSQLLGYANLFAGVTSIMYSIAVFAKNKMVFNLFSSLYLIGLDWMLLSILGFALRINQTMSASAMRKLQLAVGFFVVLDTISLLLNPFLNCTIISVPSGNEFPHFTQEIKPLFRFHLGLIYFLVAIIIYCVFRKGAKIPHEYRSPFKYVVLLVMLETIMNAVFLLTKNESVFARINISPITYGWATAMIYWIMYKYSQNGMMRIFKQELFDHVNCALLLFDYEQHLILRNKAAKQLFSKLDTDSNMTLQQFAWENHLDIYAEKENVQSFMCYLNHNEKDAPYRGDFKLIRNKSNAILGYLLMFTDAVNESDILTGFQSWNFFESYIESNPSCKSDTHLVIIDINALSVINNTFGRNEGDKKIKKLADLMKHHFPSGTYFIRGNEANLIALTENMELQEFKECISKIKDAFPGSMQYAINSVKAGESSISAAIQDAENALKTKKLQDNNSSHSEFLSTLVKALEECDTDTREHVHRTRELGIALGSRIGLSDIQQSNLSLLCLLHDIGKIAIPLEILNKPGKLTDEEWVIMRSHVEKGFQIASSSKELSIIADMILHHHERWDGKGYPSKLSKEEIPLLSRMISVIDAYDAMVNDRIYRPALSKEDAINELKRCAGSQFDPYICEEFIKMVLQNEEVDNSKAAAALRNSAQDIQNDADEIEKVSLVQFCRYHLDADYYIIDPDEHFETFTGYTEHDLAEKKLAQFDLIPANDRTEYANLLTDELEPTPGVFPKTLYFEHRIQKKNGDTMLVLCMGNIHRDAQNVLTGIEVTIANIMHTQAVKQMLNDEKRKGQKRLMQWESQYRNDPLTGLMNRATFKNEVQTQMNTQSYRIMLVTVDVDRFHQKSEAFAATSADDWLVLTGQTLSSLVRENDLVCRMGGDEFTAALFFDRSAVDGEMFARADTIYDLFAAKMSATIEMSGIAMGAAISTERLNSFDLLMQQTDRMLCKAKQNGGNQIFYEYNDENEHLGLS